jgi:hypothetical protein
LLIAPQLGQAAFNTAPHSLQNFAPASLAVPQLAQITFLL